MVGNCKITQPNTTAAKLGRGRRSVQPKSEQLLELATLEEDPYWEDVINQLADSASQLRTLFRVKGSVVHHAKSTKSRVNLNCSTPEANLAILKQWLQSNGFSSLLDQEKVDTQQQEQRELLAPPTWATMKPKLRGQYLSCYVENLVRRYKMNYQERTGSSNLLNLMMLSGQYPFEPILQHNRIVDIPSICWNEKLRQLLPTSSAATHR